MENRHGLAVDGSLTPATGFAEREQALTMATRLPAGATLGADKSYDTRDFVDGLRGLAVTPHIAQNTTHRRSTLDRRTTRHPGYQTSQQHRKRIEEIFGWLKTVGLLRKARHRGAARVGWMAGRLQPGPAAATRGPADMSPRPNGLRLAASALAPARGPR
jgi:hypothetical protein